jgi:hypothetical protein
MTDEPKSNARADAIWAKVPEDMRLTDADVERLIDGDPKPVTQIDAAIIGNNRAALRETLAQAQCLSTAVPGSSPCAQRCEDCWATADAILQIIDRLVAEEREACAAALTAKAEALRASARGGIGMMFATQTAAELDAQAAAIRRRGTP